MALFYFIVKGVVVDVVINLELCQAYIDLYKVCFNGDKILECIGFYFIGQFIFGFDLGDIYEFNIIVFGYKFFKKVFKVDFGGVVKMII